MSFESAVRLQRSAVAYVYRFIYFCRMCKQKRLLNGGVTVCSMECLHSG